MLTELGGDAPAMPVREALLERPAVEQTRSSFWGRKSSKVQVQESRPARPVSPPVKVEVEMDQVNFRTENDFGLYETIRGKGVVVKVDIR